MKKVKKAKKVVAVKKIKKKAVAKKNINQKSIGIRVISNPEHYFYMCDGRVLKDLIELANSLEQINEDIFRHHVNNDRNDFANWVRDIFEEHTLADELIQVSEPGKVQMIIFKHLAKK